MKAPAYVVQLPSGDYLAPSHFGCFTSFGLFAERYSKWKAGKLAAHFRGHALAIMETPSAPARVVSFYSGAPAEVIQCAEFFDRAA
jgi:hypothetical protein